MGISENPMSDQPPPTNGQWPATCHGMQMFSHDFIDITQICVYFSFSFDRGDQLWPEVFFLGPSGPEGLGGLTGPTFYFWWGQCWGPKFFCRFAPKIEEIPTSGGGPTQPTPPPPQGGGECIQGEDLKGPQPQKPGINITV